MYKLKGLEATVTGLQTKFEQVFQDDEWDKVQTKSKELSEQKLIVSIAPMRITQDEFKDLLLKDFATEVKALGDC